MATPASRLIQDQNLNIHSTGAHIGGKIDASKATKKAALGGRRALNDISNSGKPSVLQPSTKHNPINVVSNGKDLHAGKANFSKASEKAKAGGRKALTDLTNSVKPLVQPLSKNNQDKKLSAVEGENIPSAIKGEAFLHNHQECMNAQRNKMNFGCFLDAVGLENGGSSLVLPESLKLKTESPVKRSEMEEMPMILNEDDKGPECWEAEFSGFSSPISVKPPYENWKDESFPGFTLIETPKLQKY